MARKSGEAAEGDAASTARAHWLWLVTAGAATACFFVLSTRPVQAQPVNAGTPPPQSTTVEVRITGIVADVTVTQVDRHGKVEVARHYTEPLAPLAGQYRFVLPAAAIAGSDLRVAMVTPVRIRQVTSDTHAIRVVYEATGEALHGDRARVTLAEGGASGKSTANPLDFVLDYSLADEPSANADDRWPAPWQAVAAAGAR